MIPKQKKSQAYKQHDWYLFDFYIKEIRKNRRVTVLLEVGVDSSHADLVAHQAEAVDAENSDNKFLRE